MPTWLEDDEQHWVCDVCGEEVRRHRPRSAMRPSFRMLRMPPAMTAAGWRLKRRQRGHEWEVLCPGCAEYDPWEMYRREYHP